MVGVTVFKFKKLESFIIVLLAMGVDGVECALKCVRTGVAVGVVIEDAFGRDVEEETDGSANEELPTGGGALRPLSRCLSEVWRETGRLGACAVGVTSPIAAGVGGRGPDGGGRGVRAEDSEEYVTDGSMIVSRT